MSDELRQVKIEDYDKLYDFYYKEIAYSLDPIKKAEALHLTGVLYTKYKEKNPDIDVLQFCIKLADKEGVINGFTRWFIVPFSIELKYMVETSTKFNNFGFTSAKDIKARIDDLILDWLPF